jgi:hypothetical protein
LYLDADYTRRGVQRVEARRCWFQRSELVHFSKIHSVGKLKSGNLPGMELHFQIRLQDGNVDGFTLSGVRALSADAVELHIPVMRFYEFVYDRIHDV